MRKFLRMTCPGLKLAQVGYPLHSGNHKGLWVDARRVHPIAREETLHCVHARVQRLLRAGWLFSGLLRRTPPAGNQKHPAHRFGSPADGFATAATTTYCGYLSQVASPLAQNLRELRACMSLSMWKALRKLSKN